MLLIDESQKIRPLKQPFPRSQESRDVEVINSGSETGMIEEMITGADESFYNY